MAEHLSKGGQTALKHEIFAQKTNNHSPRDGFCAILIFYGYRKKDTIFTSGS